MPTDKTITAKEAGVFLPGQAVSGGWRGIGTVIIPSADAMMERPHGDTDIFVRWRDGSETWVRQEELKYR